MVCHAAASGVKRRYPAEELQRRRATSPRPRVERVRSKFSKARPLMYTGERTLTLQTSASDGGLKTFFCRLGLGISPAGIVADAISAMGAVASQLFENRSAGLDGSCVGYTRLGRFARRAKASASFER